VTCPDCDYPIEIGSPRSNERPEPRIKFKPWDDLDEDSRKVWRSAERAAAAVAGWPSWKLGRCNCPGIKKPDVFPGDAGQPWAYYALRTQWASGVLESDWIEYLPPLS